MDISSHHIIDNAQPNGEQLVARVRGMLTPSAGPKIEADGVRHYDTQQHLHRADGPAVELHSGICEFWDHGQFLSFHVPVAQTELALMLFQGIVGQIRQQSESATFRGMSALDKRTALQSSFLAALDALDWHEAETGNQVDRQPLTQEYLAVSGLLEIA